MRAKATKGRAFGHKSKAPPSSATSAAVAKATQTPFAMAWDRSGHRFAGPAISYGAKLFDAAGNLGVDETIQIVIGDFAVAERRH